MKRLLHYLEEILSIPSPTGDTKEALLYVKNVLDSLKIQTKYTKKGALMAFIPGENHEKAVTFSAHVDTLGAMVREIKANGRLKMTQIGGYAYATIEGEDVLIRSEEKDYTGTVLIDAASTHVYGEMLRSQKRDEDHMEVRIDEITYSKEETEALGISVGDYIAFKPKVDITPSGYVKSRHLDDKAAVAVMLEMANHFIEKAPYYDTYLFFSNYEEVGHGSSTPMPAATEYFIAIDMAAVGEGQSSREEKVTICMKDSSGPYDLELSQYLVSLAKRENLPYAKDIYPYYGSDASAARTSGLDAKCALIGPGVDASHNHERTHRDALKATLDLSLAFSYHPMK